MKYVICLLVVLMVGCGKAQGVFSDPEITPYVSEFFYLAPNAPYPDGRILLLDEDDFRDYVKNPVILGVCSHSKGQWTIRINKRWFDAADEQNKKQLLFHELTHCAFDYKSHSSDSRSYMYAGFIPFASHLDDQVKQLASEL